MKNFLVIVIFLLFGLDGFAQQPDARIIIKGVNEKFAKVKDYQANARIDTRISFLKILHRMDQECIF